MNLIELLNEKWSKSYKKSINCSNPKGFSQRAHCAGRKKNNEAVEPDEPGYQHDVLTMPQNTLVIDTPGELDWYKIGQHFPTLGKEDPHEYGQSESDMVVSFANTAEMKNFIKVADKLGLKIKSIGGTIEHPEIHSELREGNVYQLGTKPKLIRIHYFRVEPYNADIAKQIGLQQDRGGNWVLYQYNTSGAGFNQKYSSAVRSFGQPSNSQSIKESHDGNSTTFMDALEDFLPLALKHLDIDHVPSIKLQKQVEVSDQPTFGRFANDDNVIYLGIGNRHPVDILRTLAHELTHYKQNLQGVLDASSGETGSSEEDQANAEAGVIMRMFNKTYPQYLKLEPIELPCEQMN